MDVQTVTVQVEPGYTIKCECDSEKQYHDKGILSIYRGKDTGGSQFFICLNRHTTEHLDGVYVFWKIVKGIEILDKIKQGDKFSVVKIDYGET